MLIANPIYDSVFKYLLEDASIAKDLLELILDEQFESLELKPQEMSTTGVATGVSLLRFDFKAVFVSKTGERKKVLIELQKAKHLLDIMRFRRYLGENYRTPDVRMEGDKVIPDPLDIITIYFLGFKLANVEPAVLKSNNCYQDVLTGKMLPEKVKEPFVNLLDHEAYFIQIPRLKPLVRSRLENVLLVFSQDNTTDDHRQLNYSGSVSDELIGKIVRRLVFANADEDLQRQMEAEEEVENLIFQKDRLQEETATERDEARAQTEEALAQKAEAEAQKAEALAELARLRQKMLDAGLDPNSN